MNDVVVLAVVLLLVASGYAAGRVHGQIGYREGYRSGYRQGYADGSRSRPIRAGGDDRARSETRQSPSVQRPDAHTVGQART